MEAVTDFIFLGSKITVDIDCSHEIKRCLLLWRKAMNDKPRQCIKKQRHCFADKSPYSQSYGFFSSHVQMLELVDKEDWALRNWCFQIFVLENTLDRIPWTARRSNQSILKEINPEYSLEGLLLKLILWPYDTKSRLLEKTLMLGKIEGKRRRGWQRMRWLDSITESIMKLSKLWEIVEDRVAWLGTVHSIEKSQTGLSD